MIHCLTFTGDGYYGDRDFVSIYTSLSQVANKWREIGQALGFSSVELDII
jgi:hypothetical protein